MTRSNYDKWFLEIIAFYRRLEFFLEEPFNGLTDLQCKELIESRYPCWFRERYQSTSSDDARDERFLLESCILAEDRRRVWKSDAEWVYGDTHFYREAVVQLGNISRNVFHPENAAEHWDRFTEEHRERIVIHTAFDVRGSSHHCWITRDSSDFANPGFVAAVNRIIERTGQQFRNFGDSQDWFVVCQTDAETSAMLHRGYSVGPQGMCSGLLQYPDSGPADAPQAVDRWLYAQRGLLRYAAGGLGWCLG